MTLTQEMIDQLQPGKELNAYVAEFVMGLKPCSGWTPSGMMRIQACWTRTDACPHGRDGCFWIEHPTEYSQNYSAAMLVVDKMSATHDAVLSWKTFSVPPWGSPLSTIEREAIVRFTRRSDRNGSSFKSDSFPVSICKAALLSTL